MAVNSVTMGRHDANSDCTKKRVQGLPPIVSQKSKVLILGSMPGVKSRDAGEYFANPQNKFWDIMGELFGAGLSLPYRKRVARLKSVDVALWDTLRECEIKGSSDASIKEEVVNDFPAFFKKHTKITHVFFNGKKSEEDFQRYALPSLTEKKLLFARLPSTSSARAMNWDAKCRRGAFVVDALTAIACET